MKQLGDNTEIESGHDIHGWLGTDEYFASGTCSPICVV